MSLLDREIYAKSLSLMSFHSIMYNYENIHNRYWSLANNNAAVGDIRTALLLYSFHSSGDAAPFLQTNYKQTNLMKVKLLAVFSLPFILQSLELVNIEIVT